MNQAFSAGHTKEILADSLMQKTLKKPLEKITVTELIEDCGINRRTFYYHFEDIYALYEWTLHREADKWFHKDGCYRTLEECLRSLLIFLRENQTLCTRTLNGLGQEKLRCFLKSDAMGVGKNLIDELSADLDIPEKKRDFIIRFYTGAVAESVFDWLENGMTQPIDEFLQMIDCATRDSIRAALKRAAVSDA